MTEVTSAMTIYEKGERDKEHAEMLALCFPREACFLIFCGQAPLDTQYSSLYTFTMKEQCAINNKIHSLFTPIHTGPYSLQP